MREIAELVVPWIATTWLIFAILRRDERRMTKEQRARAWPDASRWSAVVVFGIFAVIVHFARTRRSVLGFLVGFVVTVLVVVASGAVEWATDALFDALA
jgi:hypothetical protein